jgi:hypothetical protein
MLASSSLGQTRTGQVAREGMIGSTQPGTDRTVRNTDATNSRDRSLSVRLDNEF